MDLSALPPEITSTLIYSGPGASSLLEASAAWDALGAELESTVAVYAATVSTLAESWSGPSSSAMIQAVQPYLTWMRNTAQQTQQTAAAAQDAAAAFNAALASVVPPAAVAANRARLAQLLATNLLGSNLPAIAQTEDEYQTMWATNSAALSRYQAASAQATTALPQFQTPASIVDPSGVAAQAAATPAAGTQAAATRAAVSAAPVPAAPVPSDTLPSVPLFQQNLAYFDPQAGWFGLANQYANQFISSGFPINLLSLGAQVQSAQSLSNIGGDVGQGLSEGEAIAGGAAAEAPTAFGGLSAEPTAAMNVGVSLGKLTAPPAVVGLLPGSQVPVQLASAATPLAAADPGFPMLPPLMPPPISAGSGWRKRKQQKYEDLEIGREIKGTVIKPPPSAG
ncbi:PPE family protein [Mycobacterium sp. Marseille-P9652]|uniref:PPE family protein n=1 Tax=Mycobacterium sp. Marseille-P9652 TaxID=2654950 RepID=UPI0012E982C0|nr:PPE family protein [Mycobacterium sp. Marseille-P9652]